jgi:hypothetical protein
MTESAKEARRAYRRKWYKENADKVRAQQERYWMRKVKEAEGIPADPEAQTATV